MKAEGEWMEIERRGLEVWMGVEGKQVFLLHLFVLLSRVVEGFCVRVASAISSV